ncbi:MAG: ACT domain-containing protein [Clostridiales bacterium]|jgi:chorismate mutase|nr:ACT domain-containing protein [Clostridiales bacterium]
MNEKPQLVLVDSKVLPEVITKVIEVKKLLANKEEKSSAAACKRVGISRSAFYKYKDSIYSYDKEFTNRIITIYAELKDEPGVLSSVLVLLHQLNANILTVNQTIPIDGVAAVTISLRLNGSMDEIYTIKAGISQLTGVVDVKILSSE